MQLFIEIWTMIENWARLNRMKREARIAEVGAFNQRYRDLRKN